MTTTHRNALAHLRNDQSSAVPVQLIISGGTGGHGGNGGGEGGGNGGLGEGPRLTFSNSVIIIHDSLAGGQASGTRHIREGLALIGAGLAELGGNFFAFIVDWLGQSVPRGVIQDMFFVMDPGGSYIAVQMQFCPDYAAFHELMKTYLRGRAASRYVERGDYSIVLEDGSFIVPARFPETIQAGVRIEMSILQRQVQNHSDTVQNTTCPHCSWPQATRTGNGWFQCSSTACARNYRIEEQNEDVEELLSPQLQVHILIFDGQRAVSFPRPLMPPEKGEEKLVEDFVSVVLNAPSADRGVTASILAVYVFLAAFLIYVDGRMSP
ncbi:hypothetical protein B0H14DRAFT_3534071 [Mycena olivaceomarginata]|nr:hypothetical protein B0H14DRAFT_3534071 [Mycena olivaceomarginata]